MELPLCASFRQRSSCTENGRSVERCRDFCRETHDARCGGPHLRIVICNLGDMLDRLTAVTASACDHSVTTEAVALYQQAVDQVLCGVEGGT